MRVHVGFKGEVLELQVELQLERQKHGGKAPRITEGEIIELMLKTFKAARCCPCDADTGRHMLEAEADRAPIAQGAGRGLKRLVVEKVAELGLILRK